MEDHHDSFEELELTIQNFEECTDIRRRGVLLGVCYKQLNCLENSMKDNLSQERSIQQKIEHQKVSKLKSQLIHAHKVFLQETLFESLIQDALKLAQQKKNKVDDNSTNFFVRQIKEGHQKIQRNKLSDKNKKLFDDAIDLANNFGRRQFIEDASSYNDSMIIQEIEDNNHEDELNEIIQSAYQLNRIAVQINLETQNQNIQLQQFDESVDKIQQNTDHAVNDYIEAHNSVLSYRRKQIQLFFAALFGAITPLFTGFGCAIGGVVGLIAGNFVAKCSQLGVKEKVGNVDKNIELQKEKD